MNTRWAGFCTIAIVVMSVLVTGVAAQPPRVLPRPAASELAIIKTDARTGFSNTGWKYDRYADLPSLDVGNQVQWSATETIEAGTTPSPDNWRTLEDSLQPFAGKTAVIIIEVAYSGKTNHINEESLFDEISIVPQR